MEGGWQCGSHTCRVSTVQDEASDGMDPLISLHIGMSHEAITKAWTQYLKTLTTVSHTTNFHNVMNIDDGLWRFLPSCHLFIFEYLNEAGASRHILVQHIPSLAVL
jgi:hypothetical protein